MKVYNLLYVISLCVFFYGCGGNGQKNDRENDNLKGEVKAVRQIDYAAVDNAGKTEKGAELYRTKTVYNRDGNVTELEVFMYGEPVYAISFEYDGDGRKTGGKKYGSYRQLEQVFDIRYDDKGNPVEQVYYYPDGAMAYRTLLKYDKNGYVAEQSDYDGNGNLEYRQVFVNDNKGNRTELRQYDPDGTLDQRHIFSYDGNGKLTEVKSYDADGTLFDLYTYKNNSDGSRAEMSFQLDGEQCHYKYEYELDGKGNFIRCTEYDMGKKVPETITERTIEYY